MLEDDCIRDLLWLGLSGLLCLISVLRVIVFFLCPRFVRDLLNVTLRLLVHCS